MNKVSLDFPIPGADFRFPLSLRVTGLRLPSEGQAVTAHVPPLIRSFTMFKSSGMFHISLGVDASEKAHGWPQLHKGDPDSSCQRVHF